MRLYRDIWRLLDRHQRLLLVLSQLLSVLIGLSTLGGIAAVIPFFAVLGDPQAIDHSALLGRLYHQLGFGDQRQFVVALGAGFVVALFLSNALNLVGFLAITRFSYRIGREFHVALFDEYLHRDLLFHARAHGAALFNNIIHEADRVATGIVQSSLVLATHALTSTLIVVSVLLVNPRIALVASVGIGGSYGLLYLVVHRRVARRGREESRYTAERARIASESLAGIREITLAGSQEFVRQRFAQACAGVSRAAASAVTTAQSPRYVIEALTGAGLVGTALLLTARGSGGAPWLAQLTFMGFAAFRLMPALQQAFAASVRIRADRSAFELIAADLAVGRSRRALAPSPADASLGDAPRSGIRLRDVTFRYAADDPLAVRDVSLHIPAGAMVGFVGRNGSGKTTLADLILGLLRPASGRIEIDGVALTPGNCASWHKRVAYVPQAVFLADATIAQNIAFGVAPEAIDEARLQCAARAARVEEFATALPRGWHTEVGERGVRLSGGERQRIGIARALYRDARLLVMDEATSALDADAEREIMAALAALRGSATVILITHRLASLRNCDVIFEVEGGRIAGQGSFEELLVSSARFRRSVAGEPAAAARES